MGRKQPDAAEVKHRLLEELEAARAAISWQVSLAQVHLNPATMARRSLEKHRWAWLAGGTLAGVILVRMLLPAKIRSDKSGETARKRGVSAVAAGLVFALARRALTNYATTHLREHAKNYLDSILNRRDPV